MPATSSLTWPDRLRQRLDDVLPPETRPGVWQRGLTVWGVALFIAVAQWAARQQEHPLPVALVYSYAISTLIWFFTDPLRLVLRRWLHPVPPHEWTLNPRSGAWLLGSIVLGFALGISVGDAFAGRSTWALLAVAPLRFWGIWLGSLGVSLGFLFYFFQRERAQALQRQATEAQLRLLESQLEPHMLFNTLANLRVLISLDPARALHMLDRLNGYLRATLQASRSSAQQHTLADEFARLADYLELMSIRMGPRLQTVLDLPQALQGHPLPPLLLQPLVENAIRHGLEPSVQGGCIRVSAHSGAAGLVLEVHDSGQGFAGEPQAGFGLTQVRQRLATAYAGRAALHLQSTHGQGTTARLSLPLRSPVLSSNPPASVSAPTCPP